MIRKKKKKERKKKKKNKKRENREKTKQKTPLYFQRPRGLLRARPIEDLMDLQPLVNLAPSLDDFSLQ